jgi:membrane protease YdiL (CAAX protease family)
VLVSDDPVHPPRELALVAAASFALAIGVTFVPEAGEGTLLHAVKPTLWVLAWAAPAWIALERRKKDPLVLLGLWKRPADPLSWLVALATLPAYALLLPHVNHRSFHLAGFQPYDLVAQLLFVALPEETFFRGSLQPSVLPKRPYASIIIASVVFALAHLATDRNPARLLVFFPSLVFGWLRLRSGSLIPGIVFHALCNVLEKQCT